MGEMGSNGGGHHPPPEGSPSGDPRERRAGGNGSAAEAIDVLLVEDDHFSAHALLESLAGPRARGFRVTHVERLREAALALSGSRADVVLLDLSLPDSDGLETVNGVQAAAPGVPIVVLTGLNDEQLGLEAVRRGVQDYLVKGQCEAGLVARALRYAVERRRAEAALRESEGRFRTMFEATSDAILVADDAAALVDANPAASELTGYPRGELLGKKVWDLTEPTDREATTARWAAFLAAGRERGEFLILRKDRAAALVDYNAFAGIQPGLHMSVLRDVTERNRKDRELGARARQQAAVAWLGQVALEQQDVRVVMDDAVRLLARTLGADFASVLELQPDGDALLLRGGAGWEQGLVGRATIPAGKGSQAGFTLLSGEPVVVVDFDNEPRFDRTQLLKWHGVVSGMSTVIAAPGRGRPYGVLTVHTRQVRQFSADDIHFLQAVANVIAAAVERRRSEHALRSSETKFRILADGSPVLMWVNGLTGAEFVNRAYLDFVGVPAEADLLGYDWAQFVHPKDRDAYIAHYLECVTRLADYEAECRIRRHDGEYRRMRSVAKPRFSPSGEFLGYVGSTVDITEARRAEDAIRDSLARLSAVVDTAVDAIITIDGRGRIESVNPATERLFGYAPDEMVGESVMQLMPEAYRGEYEGHVRRYLRNGEGQLVGPGGEVVGLRKDGGTVPLSLSVSEFRLGGRRMFTGILHDVTERRRLERQILDISSAEQRRIGQDLHDGLCQELVGVAFAAKLLADRLESKLPDEAAGARELAAMVDGAITQARALAHGLNPVELHGGDLATALAALASKVSSLFRVDCRCRCDEKVVLPDGSAATHLYRIAQEAVSNAVKHGNAGRIDIEVTSGEAGVTLSVSDDGRGIPAVLPETAGIGLSTMRYRARIIGGCFSVQPGPRHGTVVTCAVPRQPVPDGPAAGTGETARKRRGGRHGASHQAEAPAASNP